MVKNYVYGFWYKAILPSLTGLILLVNLITINSVQATCPCSAAKTITLPYSSGNKTLQKSNTASDSLCITGTGTFSNNLTLQAGGVLIICSGASMNMTGVIAFYNNSLKNKIYNYGTFKYTGNTATANFDLDRTDIHNYGTFEVVNSMTQYANLASTITNYAGATFKVGKNYTINAGGGSFSNNGDMIIGGALTLNNSTYLDANSGSTVTVQDLYCNNGAKLDNSSVITASNLMNFSTSSGVVNVNDGVFITKDLTVNTSTFNNIAPSCGGFIVSDATKVYGGATWTGSFAIADSSHSSTGDENYCSSSCPVYSAPNDAMCPYQLILPVNFNYFQVTVIENNLIELEWGCSYEENNEYFAIERSEDGVTFTEVAMINGNGSVKLPTHYIYVDKYTYFSRLYYRIKQVDYNGNYSFSKVISSEIVKPDFTFEIFPNPVSNSELLLQIGGVGENEQFILVIKDQLGQTVHLQDIIGSSYTIPSNIINKLSSGIYSILVTTSKNTICKNLYKN